jgi:hypothetical protein
VDQNGTTEEDLSTAPTNNRWVLEHYQRPEIKEVILRFCQEGEAWRALNGDNGWYISAGNGKVRLRSPKDYEDTAAMLRTLYATLDLFDPHVKKDHPVWKEEGNPEKLISTFEHCHAYTLGDDIDSNKLSRFHWQEVTNGSN